MWLKWIRYLKIRIGEIYTCCFDNAIFFKLMYIICCLIFFLNFKSTKHYTPNQNKTPLPDSPMKALIKTQNTVIFIKLMSCFEFKNITLRQCCFYYGRQSWTIAYTSLLLLAFYRTFVGKLKKSHHHVMTTTSSKSSSCLPTGSRARAPRLPGFKLGLYLYNGVNLVIKIIFYI